MIFPMVKGKPDMKTLILTSEDVRALPTCERVGLVYPWFDEPDAARLAKTVVSAEATGSAAAMHTKDIRLGTAIIPASRSNNKLRCPKGTLH